MANWMKLMKNQASDYQHNLKFLKQYRMTGDRDALEWLVLNNANLVHKIVNSYRTFYHHKLSYDDLFSVGLEGLLRAIEKFDFSYKNNFATYASYWIKQSVMRLISDEGFMMKIPAHLFETLQQMIRYECHNDQKRSKKEMCELLEISGEKYDLLQQVRGYMLKWTSLNRPVSEVDDTEIGDLISTETVGANQTTESLPIASAAVEAKELQRALKEGLKFLEPREQLIIIHRFGLFGVQVKTLAEIGKSEGISRERIRQLESRAIRKLKKIMRGYEGYLNN